MSDYLDECKRLCEMESVQEILKKNPELDTDFLGFLNDYRNIADKIPKRFAVIDLGCNSAIQSVYFEDHHYIGIDTVPVEIRLNIEENLVSHMVTTIQEYCKTFPPSARECSFAFCCNVPDNKSNQVWDLVRKTFRYYCITYPGRKSEIVLPKEE